MSKDTNFHFRISSEDKERLLKNAERAGISASEYVIKRCCVDVTKAEKQIDKIRAIVNQ